ncbi:MAG: bacterial Ig-like domain-containing protein, partial [Spirochaetaceae bacterium]|nr:bacterial Ig-like domain-containing protein [Spirochaetaceae bacterium]
MKKTGLFLFGLAALVFTGCKTLEGIEVVSRPSRTVFGQGQEFSAEGLVVNALYDKGDTEAVTIPKTSVTGYDKHRTGIQRITVTYQGKTTSFEVTVVPLVSLTMTSPPSKTRYKLGENFNGSGMVFQGEWEEIGSQRLPAGAVAITGYNKDMGGVQTLTGTYEGQTVTFTVEVVSLTGITVVQPPAKTVYKAGESLNLEGLVVQSLWGDTPGETVTITSADVSGFDTTRPGAQTLVVTYEGKTAAFQVTVAAMSALTITSNPRKLRYKTGESLDLSGLTVMGAWEGIGDEYLSVGPRNVTGFDPDKIGVQTLTVRVNNRTAAFQVSVAGLVSLKITSFPDKLTYVQGEPLDFTGLQVMGVYSDRVTSYEEPVNVSFPRNFSAYDPNRLGSQVITVTVGAVSANFPISIVAARSPSYGGIADAGRPGGRPGDRGDTGPAPGGRTGGRDDTGPAPGGRSGGRDDEGGPATASGGRAGGKADTGATASTPGGRTGGRDDTGPAPGGR